MSYVGKPKSIASLMSYLVSKEERNSTGECEH